MTYFRKLHACSTFAGTAVAYEVTSRGAANVDLPPGGIGVRGVLHEPLAPHPRTPLKEALVGGGNNTQEVFVLGPVRRDHVESLCTSSRIFFAAAMDASETLSIGYGLVKEVAAARSTAFCGG